eukprot:GCRY01000287.1.p1 GENE.GCRY01000287.1~~GCRY01000287.1.p1  ORF type:complete len:898 (+),score=266.42 GCRY01000287.1:43-2694(+)
MVKRVYTFANGKAEGNAEMRDVLGGKGANLAEMTNLGIPVPPGFTISCDECNAFYRNGSKLSEDLKKEVLDNLKKVEEILGKKFGDKENPLLFSVRSGARVSMPGMMDTVLNLGLNRETLQALVKKTGNERFAWDSFRRFIQMYSNVVLGMEGEILEHIIDEKKKALGIKFDTDFTVDHLKELVEVYLPKVKEVTGVDFPMDPTEQLFTAIAAVFQSWNIPRAIAYRKLNGISDEWGTAVNCQSMVFGNMGDTSATGVAFTRDPKTGEHCFFGEFLVNAQGEDVVAGIRTPMPINHADKTVKSLETVMPEEYAQLVKIQNTLENHFRDMQDLEFTIEEKKLWLLQTRNGKRTAKAAVKIAVDLVNEGLITKEQAILRVAPASLDQLLHPTLDTAAKKEKIASGLPASPGAACGSVVFTAEDAAEAFEKGDKVILVRLETSPEDIEGMNAAQGILTCRGGQTSHAAVVARGMGKCCVCGCADITISGKSFSTADGTVYKEGDFITLDGATGEVFKGKVPTVSPKLDGDFSLFMKWADEFATLKVRTNADTPKDAQVARDFGAQGIGLCRTEHMFFEADRILAIRQMILSHDREAREVALAKLLPYQRGDFYGLFKAMTGLPVTIRLLDPPLHEFLPDIHDQKAVQAVATELGVSAEVLTEKIESLHEVNPMLGHRGCRLGCTLPEITAMQSRAIFEAACDLQKEGTTVVPEVMIPLIGTLAEFSNQKKIIVEVAEKVMAEKNVKVDYLVGTMIEIPRAAILAGQVAQEAQFFSFGTNDLTQMTYGYSRDDAGKFLPFYLDNKILPSNPFQTVDQEGVGFLMNHAVTNGRSTRSNLKCGICGEHGGDPASVKFCHKIGLNYVSCSPFRVPIARLAAAQAAIENKQ